MRFKDRVRGLLLELGLKVRVVAAAIDPFGGDITPTGRLYATKITPDGLRQNLGLISTKVVTDAGVQFIVDGFQNSTTSPISNFKFHGSGTGTTGELANQTVLVTETGTRVTGTQVEGASANIYRTVATISYSGTLAITEHAVFSASSAGTMLDRSVFAAVNVQNLDAIEFTYELTLPSGS